MYALGPWASGIHIRQIPPAHVTTYTKCMYIFTSSLQYTYSYWSVVTVNVFIVVWYIHVANSTHLYIGNVVKSDCGIKF